MKPRSYYPKSRRTTSKPWTPDRSKDIELGWNDLIYIDFKDGQVTWTRKSDGRRAQSGNGRSIYYGTGYHKLNNQISDIRGEIDKIRLIGRR